MPPLSSRLKNAVFSYVMYIEKMFWPTAMAPELPHRGASLAAWQVLGCIAILLAITALVLMARKYRYLPVGWFWFLGILVPMIGILQAGRQGMADRSAISPTLGSSSWCAGASPIGRSVGGSRCNGWPRPAR